MRKASELTGICGGAAVEVRDGICTRPFGVLPSGIEAGAGSAGDAAGVTVHIPDGLQAAEPLCLSFGGRGSCRVEVVAGKDSAAELLFLLSDGASVVRNTVVQEGASLRMREVVLLAAEGSVSGSVRLEAGARSETVTVAFGSGKTALRYAAQLAGPAAEALHAGLFMAADGERKELDVRVEHLVPDCHSDVLMKGVASGTGYGSFDGMVYVAQDAQRTEAYQQSRNLLMGDRARIVTSPRLEIYADDVRCSHGATVGQMDDDAVYYMRRAGAERSRSPRPAIDRVRERRRLPVGRGAAGGSGAGDGRGENRRTPAGCLNGCLPRGCRSVAKETYCGDTKENRQCVRWGKPCRTEAEPRSGRMLPGRKQDGTGQEAG